MRLAYYPLLTGLLATVAVLAHADRNHAANDALGTPSPRITLGQAIATAENHVAGRAARAEYERTRQGWLYDIEVSGPGGKVFDVKVDGETGMVQSSHEDPIDADDQDEEDEEDEADE